MKRAAYRNKKVNNKGMTLVEILVAFAILTVAIIPLMYGFVYIARHNASARAMQQTSVFAHTVIENCKAFTLREIEERVTNNTFLPDASSSDIKTSAYSGSNGVYHFNDVKVYDDGAGNASEQKYDIQMTISPYEYSSGFSANKSMMNYENINAYTDAVFVAATAKSNTSPEVDAVKFDTSAYDFFLEKIADKVNGDSISTHSIAGGVGHTKDDVKLSLASGGTNAGILKMKRYITVNTAHSSVNGNDYANVTYKYTYTLTSDYKYDIPDATQPTGFSEVTVDCNDASLEYERTVDIYDNTKTKDDTELERVYFFYYPPYNNVGITFEQEEITFINSISRNLEVYFVKQFRNESITDGVHMTQDEVKNAENSYNPKMLLTCTDPSKDIYFYHNLDVNIGGGTSGWDSNLIGSDVVEMDLILSENKQLMYNVKVEIFAPTAYDSANKAMTGDALSSMSGTFLNW